MYILERLGGDAGVGKQWALQAGWRGQGCVQVLMS